MVCREKWKWRNSFECSVTERADGVLQSSFEFEEIFEKERLYMYTYEFYITHVYYTI